MDNATDVIFQIAILVMSVVIHEVSHGVAAYLQGDKTAQYAGRLTLNPIPHLDPFGSVILPFMLVLAGSPILLGWAKPVPYNPYNLRNQKWGPALVGAAGPLANILVALFFGVVIRVGIMQPYSIQLAAFIDIAQRIVFLNLVLAIFNLVPIPPLDGSKVLLSALPTHMWRVGQMLEMYGFALLLIFIFFFSSIVGTASAFLFHLITGL